MRNVSEADQHPVERFVRRGERNIDDDVKATSVHRLHARFRFEEPFAA